MRGSCIRQLKIRLLRPELCWLDPAGSRAWGRIEVFHVEPCSETLKRDLIRQLNIQRFDLCFREALPYEGLLERDSKCFTWNLVRGHINTIASHTSIFACFDPCFRQPLPYEGLRRPDSMRFTWKLGRGHIKIIASHSSIFAYFEPCLRQPRPHKGLRGRGSKCFTWNLDGTQQDSRFRQHYIRLLRSVFLRAAPPRRTTERDSKCFTWNLGRGSGKMTISKGLAFVCISSSFRHESAHKGSGTQQARAFTWIAGLRKLIVLSIVLNERFADRCLSPGFDGLPNTRYYAHAFRPSK